MCDIELEKKTGLNVVQGGPAYQRGGWFSIPVNACAQ
jgi:hypothetical protein